MTSYDTNQSEGNEGRSAESRRGLIAVVCVSESVETIITEVNLILLCLCKPSEPTGICLGTRTEPSNLFPRFDKTFRAVEQLLSLPLHCTRPRGWEIEWLGSSNQRLNQQQGSSGALWFLVSQIECWEGSEMWPSKKPLMSLKTSRGRKTPGIDSLWNKE